MIKITICRQELQLIDGQSSGRHPSGAKGGEQNEKTKA